MASSQASGVNTPPYVDLKRAVELMLDGHPVIFPTETFFALGSRALDADATARRADMLGKLVTIARFPGGVHDLTLSEPPVREQVFSAMRRWLGGYVLR